MSTIIHRLSALSRPIVVAWATALLSTSACGGKPADSPQGSVKPVARKSGAQGREKLAITVYNQGFGLVRDVRRVKLGEGRVELEFADVSAHIQPETVHVQALGQDDPLQVLEQNYRYDLLTPEKLLEKYEGKQVTVYRYNEKTGKDEKLSAKVLAVKGGPILEIDGEVTYDFPGRIAFPGVPSNLVSKPSLVWLLDSKVAEQKLEVSYLTRELGWKADYVFVIDAKDAHGDLTGWVTLSNQSGTDYEHARLKLVAGDVQRLAPDRGGVTADRLVRVTESSNHEAGFKEESFFEYHLYTLQRPTTLLDQEQKQVTLLEAQGAKVKKQLIYYGAQHYFRGRYGQVIANQKVGVYLKLKNSKQSGLGMPLPAGTVRVYKSDSSGARQFIGEDHIDHTPKDEEVRIKMGEAFDVVGERKQRNWTSLGRCGSESEWEVELRNHKDEAVSVQIFEPVGGDWEVTQSSHRPKKEDARTLVFDVQVPANGKTKVSYRVRVRWC